MSEKILIIEDEPLVRRELKAFLEENGFQAEAPELFVWSAALSVGIFLMIYALYVLAAYLGYKRKVMEHIE